MKRSAHTLPAAGLTCLLATVAGGAAAQETMQIGFAVSMTGYLAPYDSPTVDGAMIAIELGRRGDPDLPAGDAVKAVLEVARAHGVLALSAGVHGNVLRMLPPLTITDAQLHEALDVIEGALAEVLA